jgi:diguanylate cyclase (GGDEF)-like protein/PAS domain S-box-containing protein
VPDISRSFETTVWEKQSDQVRQHGRLLAQTEHWRKDGSQVPTEVALRYVPGEPHDYIIGIMRDIRERRQAEMALAEREAQLRTLIEAVPDSVQFKDGRGRWLIANSICLRTFDLQDKEWQGRSDADISLRYPELSAALTGCTTSDEAAWLAGKLYRTEEAIADHDGQPAYWDVIKVPLFNDDGSRRALVVVSRDITLYRKAEQGLRLAASVFQASREGIAISDAKANLLDVNEAFCRITGYDRDEVIGQNPRILKSGLHDESFYRSMWQTVIERGFWSGEIWNRRKDGRLYPELLTITAVRNPAGDTTQYVGIFTDITVLKQHEKQLERIAHYDALTGIPNRVLLADRMHQAIAQTDRDGNSMAVGYLDLDGFKPINDRFGHEAGDRLLVEVAMRLKNVLRSTDTVARLGGDEFVFLLIGVDKVDDWTETLQRILESITRPMALAGQSVSISASIGVTLYPEDDDDPDTLLRHADQAMYQAKEGGRNRYHLYDPEHDRRAKSHREAFARIKQALAANEFELHYQPKVNMRSGKVIGAEALIRWRHPIHGLMPPGEFLPVIENSDLDSAIGEWVLSTALSQMQAWQEQGFDLQISINVSAHHLQQENFMQQLVDALLAHPAVPPGRLQLEILETAALEDIAGISDIMRRCLARGVTFALDDFGTGYSSLTYLKRLPAETLKIDQSFVRDILEDPEDLAIVQGVIALSKAFGHTVIAEGVETAGHGLLLLRLGCELAQGYGIAKAMTASDLPQWLRTWQPDPRWSPA